MLHEYVFILVVVVIFGYEHELATTETFGNMRRETYSCHYATERKLFLSLFYKLARVTSINI